MDEKLISILETLGYDVILQGSLDSEEEYPSSFFTYWNWENPREQYYDNKHKSVASSFQIQFYTTDMKILDSVVNQAVQLLEENDFMLDEEPINNYSDIPNYKSKTFDVIIEQRRI